MKFDLVEYGIDPKEFLEAVRSELWSTSAIGVEVKEPLMLLSSLLEGQYELGTEGMFSSKEELGAFFEKSTKLMQAELNIEIDNVLPYILLATQFWKHYRPGARAGVPKNIYTCVQDVLEKKISCQDEKLFGAFEYTVDHRSFWGYQSKTMTVDVNEQFEEMAKRILSQVKDPVLLAFIKPVSPVVFAPDVTTDESAPVAGAGIATDAAAGAGAPV